MSSVSKRGRPRKFNQAEALAQATAVFYEKGYEGASLDDLTQAMGINRPSLYASFGNKETLFLSCLQDYTQQGTAQMKAMLSEGSAREAIQTTLNFFAQNFTQQRNCQQQMGGCLVVNSTILACKESKIGAFLQALHQEHEALIAECLQRGVERDEFPLDTEVKALAQALNGMIQGMGILARAQQSPEAILNLARMAPRILP